MTPNLLEERIIELAFTPFSELPDKLTKLGLKCHYVASEGQVTIDNGFMRVGFCECDPVSKAVQLSFALCGPLWAHVMPDLLKKVKKEWKLRKRNSRGQ